MLDSAKDKVAQYLREKYILVFYSLIGTFIFTEVFYASRTAVSELPGKLAYAFVLGLSMCLGGDFLFKNSPKLKRLIPLFVALLFGFGFLISTYWATFPLFQTHILVATYLIFLLAPKEVRSDEKIGFHWIVYVFASLGIAASISLVLFVLALFLVWILNQLFGIELVEYIKYFGSAFFSVFLTLNIFALFVPKPEEVKSLKYTLPNLLAKTLKFFVVPVILIYVSVLLIYTLKILFQMKLPVGMVSLPISIAYTMFFILNAYLESQGEENIGFWKYRRWLELSFVPLFITMGIGIAKRISDYGFTTDRFYLLAGFIVMVTSFIIRFKYKRLELRKLIFVASILFLITSFGALNPVNVSVKSQSGRFIEVLKKYQTSFTKLEDFKLSDWSQDDIDSASSALNFISQNKGIETLKKYGIDKKVFELGESGKLLFSLEDGLQNKLNLLSRNSSYSADKNKSKDSNVCKAFSVDYEKRIKIYNTRGFDAMYTESMYQQLIKSKTISDMNVLVRINLEEGLLFVVKGDEAKAAINFGAAVKDFVPKTKAGSSEKALEIVGEANGFRVKMLIEDIMFDCDRPSMEATILIKQL